MDSITSSKKTVVYNTCTRRPIVIACQRAPWLRMVREPLKFAMRYWVRLRRINSNAYEVPSLGCFERLRFQKLTLKEKSSLFRLLNSIVNPLLDILLERIVTKEEVNKAKTHALIAIEGEQLLKDDELCIMMWRMRHEVCQV